MKGNLQPVVDCDMGLFNRHVTACQRAERLFFCYNFHIVRGIWFFQYVFCAIYWKYNYKVSKMKELICKRFMYLAYSIKSKVIEIVWLTVIFIWLQTEHKKGDMLNYLGTDILAALLFVLVTMVWFFGMLFVQRPNNLKKGNKIGTKCALRRKCRIAALKCRCDETINGFILILFTLSSIM